jgi:aldehyde dehydrogenase (NAD+)
MDVIRHYSMLIDGEWVDTGDRFEIRSPATEELVATVAKGGAENANRAGSSRAGWAANSARRLWTSTPEEKFIHVDLSGRLERRAYPLLLSAAAPS